MQYWLKSWLAKVFSRDNIDELEARHEKVTVQVGNLEQTTTQINFQDRLKLLMQGV